MDTGGTWWYRKKRIDKTKKRNKGDGLEGGAEGLVGNLRKRKQQKSER